LPTGRAYGRGGRGANSFRRFGGRRCVPGMARYYDGALRRRGVNITRAH
jgi:hypothetical protein